MNRMHQAMTFAASIAGLALGVGAWGACTASPITSSVHGRVAQMTFSAPITSVVADADDGTRQRVGVDGHGQFTLVLYRHKHYRIAFETGAGVVPLALAGEHGRYLLSLDVQAGGATADIGSVRGYTVTGASSEDMARRSLSLPASPTGGTSTCAAGYFEGSSEPCMAGEAEQVCSEEDDDDGEDHQCEDGIDPNGQPCDGGPAANQNDDVEEGDVEQGPVEAVEGEVAIPELSLGSLGCEDDDDEDSEDEDDD